MKITADWVNVSHGVGVPFGAIGTGYGIFGRYGFVMPNFDSFPCQGKYWPFGIPENYDYLQLHEKDRHNFLELSVKTGGEKYYVQQELLGAADQDPGFEDERNPDGADAHEILRLGRPGCGAGRLPAECRGPGKLEHHLCRRYPLRTRSL